jgi:hypothetical protein
VRLGVPAGVRVLTLTDLLAEQRDGRAVARLLQAQEGHVEGPALEPCRPGQRPLLERVRAPRQANVQLRGDRAEHGVGHRVVAQNASGSGADGRRLRLRERRPRADDLEVVGVGRGHREVAVEGRHRLVMGGRRGRREHQGRSGDGCGA